MNDKYVVCNLQDAGTKMFVVVYLKQQFKGTCIVSGPKDPALSLGDKTVPSTSHLL